jgi:drug/metabolite transporter (DMT)-like permease
MIPALACSLLFAVSITCGHRASKLTGGASANFWRLVIATALLGLWSFSFGVGLDGAAFTYFLVSGLLGFGVGDVALYQALPRLGSRLAMLFTQCLGAPFAVIIERVWLGTQLSWTQLSCIGVIIGGVALAIAPHDSEKRDSKQWRIGAVFGVLSGLGGALGAVFSRRAFAVAGAAGETIDGANAAFQRIIGGVLIAGIFLALVRWQKSRALAEATGETDCSHEAKEGQSAWVWIACNALAGPTLGVSCMQWALRTTPTGVVLAIVAMTPLAVIPLAKIFEGERLTIYSIVGSLLAVAGVIGLICLR